MAGRITAGFVGLLALLAVHDPVSAAWQIKDFDIWIGAPENVEAVTDVTNLLGLNDVADVPPGHIAVLESYLREVARHYELLGFRQPMLEPVVTGDDGRQAYRIYLYDYPDWRDMTGAYVDDEAFAQLNEHERIRLSSTAPAGYSVRCRGMGTTPYIKIDLSRAFQGGVLRARTMENLAHELFHAVQYGYDLFLENCTLGNWIVEGTAEAMGIDTAFALRGVEPSRRRPVQRWGGRRYSSTLYVSDNDLRRKNDGYWSASLWRYIGEYMSAKVSNGLATIEPIAPDYHYLDSFFSTPLDGSPGLPDEMTWLDTGLRRETGLGLARLYANFVVTFSDYVPRRAQVTQSEEGVRRRWHRAVFGGCPPLFLSNDRPQAKVTLNLSKVATRCVKLVIGVPDGVDISVQTSGEDIARLRSLVVGVSGAKQVGRPTIVQNPAKSEEHIAHWRFHLATDTPQYLIIANVARNPATTLAQHPLLHFSISGWESSMVGSRTQGQPEASPPGSQPQPAALGGDSAVAHTAEELDGGASILSTYEGTSAQMGRQETETPCYEAFRYMACGPVTTILLELNPGLLGSNSHTTGTGAFSGQVVNMAAGSGEAGVLDLDEEMARMAAVLDATEGSSVQITIPLIDYGFSGSFANAQMSVSAEDGGAYRAVGIYSAQVRRYPLTGQVTIEEYTPFVMRGSFSADLIDFRLIDWTIKNPVLSHHASVAGRFAIAAPWEGDRRAAMLSSDDIADDVFQDAIEMFPALSGESLQEMVAAAMTREQATFGSSGGFTIELPCDCSCNRVDGLKRICRGYCAPVLHACLGQPAKGVVPLDESVLADRNGEIATLRARFAEYLQMRFQDPDMRESFLSVFDIAETLDGKRRVMLSYGANPGP